MDLIFVDTSAWCAYFDESEVNHSVAVSLMDDVPFPLITSNYVIDETLTLINIRAGHSQAVTIGERLFAGYPARLIRITEKDEKDAFKLFARYSDKKFSFTDCTSFVVMQKFGITQAFTFDKHFRQMGFEAVPAIG